MGEAVSEAVSDPKERFLAAVGRMAEAVSGRAPTAALDVEAMASEIAHSFWRGDNMRRPHAAVIADALAPLVSQLSDLEAAKNDALTLANLREAEIKRLREALSWAAPLARDRMEIARLERLQYGHDDIKGVSADGRHVIGLWQKEIDQIDKAEAVLAQPPEPTDGR